MIRNVDVRVIVIAGTMLASESLVAQPPIPGSGRPSPADMLRWADRNRNGNIDPDELVGRIGDRLKEMTRGNKNIDLSRPISIDRLIRELSRSRERSSRSTSEDSGTQGFGLEDELEPVPGFELEEELAPILGFGEKDEMFAVTVNDQDRRTAEERFRRYDSNRDGYLSREELSRNRWSDDPLVYDRNRDGRLTKEEMAVRYARRRTADEQRQQEESANKQQAEANRLLSFYKALDRNKNNILEPSEYAKSQHRSTIERRIRETGMDPSKPLDLSKFMSKRLTNAGIKSSQARKLTKDIGPAKRTSKRSDRGKSSRKSSNRYDRAKAERELYPSDIPAWFRDRDANRDGQVAMTEYSSSWTDARISEFKSLDQNSDGIITPEECLASQSN